LHRFDTVQNFHSFLNSHTYQIVVIAYKQVNPSFEFAIMFITSGNWVFAQN